MKNKGYIALILSVILLITGSFGCSLYIFAADESDKQTVENGAAASKDEVVYATTDTTGQIKGIYVVNEINVTKAGKITDFGIYDSIKNLTDNSIISSVNGKNSITAPIGIFTYQGNIKNGALPWEITLSYNLNGNDISASDLAGKSGKLEISIATKAINNDKENPFYKNYMLQISCNLNKSFCKNIAAAGGMTANAGINKTISFTVLPGSDSSNKITADVTNFHMDGIDIAALPYTLSFDMPDTSALAAKLTPLVDAIVQLNDGAKQLSDGISEYSDGISTAEGGMKQLNDGITALDENGAKLNDGSAQIRDALDMIKTELNDNALISILSSTGLLSTVNQLVDGLTQLSDNYNTFHDGLVQYTDGVSQIAKGVTEFYSGMKELSDGAEKLADGGKKLSDGTKQMADETAAMPQMMQQEIDKLTEGFTSSGFKSVSFASQSNTNISAVQFVIKTGGITLAETEANDEDNKTSKSVFDKFLDLFR